MFYKEVGGVRYYNLRDHGDNVNEIEIGTLIMLVIILLGLAYLGLQIIR
jgi:hypothetical protein